jgi:hypothetical protein
MRIHNQTSLGPPATQPGRTGKTQKAGLSSTVPTSAAGSAGNDQIELSSTLGPVFQAIGAFASQRAVRVDALAGEYDSGSFRPNSEATSQAMVIDALTAHG